ncbi:hypothetical protein [Cesiribacter sp. SM1]|uniref:hypothetical protein n=1 Tax=Cesiribacter sp. SM1 TaxID=2861196 RepID=UPI001CD3928B|nr:hypothetical protein [Cesiribacter sp. SM1]
MKTFFRSLLIAATLLLATVPTISAQTSTGGEAYWVVETNLNQKNYSIVKFYNSEHALIYEERIEGLYLNTEKRKHRKYLDRSLKIFTQQRIFASQFRKTSRF